MSLAALEQFLKVLNTLTPLGLAGLLAVIIYFMVSKTRGPLANLKSNHLHHLQMALDRIANSNDKLCVASEQQAAASEKQLDALNDIRSDISFVKGKLD